jgi:uncharacterized membrane protein HdeD (DUF308 family)
MFMKQKIKNWWLVLIKGILMVLLSFFIFANPVGTLLGLALYIGIVLVVNGILLIVLSISTRTADDQWGWKLAEGILDIIFAIILLSNPVVTAAVFPFALGFWMIFGGILLFAGSFGSKKEGNKNWWVNLLGGILTALAGYIIMSDILTGAIAITFWIGAGFLIFGIVNIAASFKLKAVKDAIE